MAGQYQREYEESYRGGRRGRGDRGDSGRWSGDDARMQPHDVDQDERYSVDSRYGRMGGRDTRQEFLSRGRGGETPGRSNEWGGRSGGDGWGSRGTEWSAEGRGGYGSESGEFEPNRWRDAYSPQGNGRYDTQSSQSWRSQADGWRDTSRGSGSEGGYGDAGRGSWRGGSRGYGYGDESGNMGYGAGEYGGYSHGQGSGQGYRQGQGGYGAESWRGFDDQSRGSGFARNWEGMQSRQGSRTSFAGRGPKDYQRSDDRIREEVSDRMTDDHDLDASEISVEVRGGEVTLTGTVRTRDQKRRAEDCAESISGVSEVVNNIRVKADDASSRGSQSSTSQSGQTGQTGQTVTPTPKAGRTSTPSSGT